VNVTPRLEELDRAVRLQRQKGDALAKRNSDRAIEAYRVAKNHADEALVLLGVDPSAGPAPDRTVAADAAEWLGLRGGLLLRIGGLDEHGALREALDSYRLGARFEQEWDLAGTYNRANAVKLALITGEATLEEEQEELRTLRQVLEQRLATDEQAADDAWLWADLGDAFFLTGDEQRALAAYTTFANKARTDSPAATLRVLREVVDALKAHHDPGASGVEKALATLETVLAPR
jgi:hypothetical protein